MLALPRPIRSRSPFSLSKPRSRRPQSRVQKFTPHCDEVSDASDVDGNQLRVAIGRCFDQSEIVVGCLCLSAASPIGPKIRVPRFEKNKDLVVQSSHGALVFGTRSMSQPLKPDDENRLGNKLVPLVPRYSIPFSSSSIFLRFNR